MRTIKKVSPRKPLSGVTVLLLSLLIPCMCTCARVKSACVHVCTCLTIDSSPRRQDRIFTHIPPADSLGEESLRDPGTYPALMKRHDALRSELTNNEPHLEKIKAEGEI